MDKDPRFTARLLAKRRGLTVQEKESMLEAIVAETSSTKQHSERSRWATALFRFRFAGLGLLVLLAVPILFLSMDQKTSEQFRAKGVNDTSPLFSVACLDATGGAVCRQGARLIFRFQQPVKYRYFASFGKQMTDDGPVIWYFPTKDTEESISLTDLDANGVISRGIAVGAEHLAGEYRIFGIFTNRPKIRAEIRRLVEGPLHFKDADEFELSSVRINMEP